jgi:hypothetical protein
MTIPDWMPMPEWEGFLAMRKKIKKVPTDRAIELLIKRLDEMRLGGEDIGQVLDQSTMNNYQGVFPVKPQDRRQVQRPAGPDMSRLGKAGQATANNAMDWLEGN